MSLTLQHQDQPVLTNYAPRGATVSEGVVPPSGGANTTSPRICLMKK